MEILTEEQRKIAKLETMLDVCRRDKDALRYQLEEAKRKYAEQSLHPTLGIRAAFQAFIYAVKSSVLTAFRRPPQRG
jgi:hypothetical protein